MRLSVKAPAKINLALDVLYKREDNYHEVKMVMTTIDLADRIEIMELSEDVIEIDSSDGFIPVDKRNLAYKAAELLKSRFGIRKGCKIEITKIIPVAAGLAGGSSDCAAVLKGLNQMWKLGLTTQELAELGAEIGSDVSFCVYGGTALATGRGEIIEKIASPLPVWVVLAKPPISVSTSDIYQKLDVNTCRHPDVEQMVKALEQKNYALMCEQLGNSLEDVTMKYYPKVAKIKQQMEKLGADGVLMSGSGPTVFGLTRFENKKHRLVNGLRGFCNQVYAVRLIG
ncbi:4-(cytidine 5'-diphospho)-2-C-methyl-D-erythritol kinase [Pueribacillus theae]|uniref:4-diphosphocytidyl-2-C-methyl-D-erythritol kinase n=1 Tax=Pueribacillus theae TaxID=2171751 RepID=A0A2U1K417_9BACI|nr:4-(cytidine 5'-diphospho)-2-C-methyl-D-erythritol kinase [Pueribacillus theae]PWA12152.1 4-(cytidine 5'-diphospho)-2-C-methyl-D-erythritol kinase [Pueribacillus theae]